MYTIKLALKNIMQNKARNLIFIAVTALTFCLIVFSLCVYRESGRQIGKIDQEYGGSVTVARFPTNATAEMTYFPPQLTLDECLSFEEYEYVNSVQVHSFIYGASKDESVCYLNGGEFSWIGWYLFLVGFNMGESNAFTESESTDYLDGRCFSGRNECVVTNIMAEQYALKIGDKIGIKDIGTGISAEYTLVGIINGNAVEARFIDANYSGNYIFTSMEDAACFNGIKRTRARYASDTPMPYYDGYNFTVTLNSYEDYDAFWQMLLTDTEMIDGYEYRYTVDYAKGGYIKLTAPLRETGTQFIRLTLLFAFLFLIIVVMSVIINVKAHKNQFGILRSMGMSKRMLCLGFLSEQTVIYFVSIVLGGVLGAAVLMTPGVSEIISFTLNSEAIGDVLIIGLCSFAAVIVTVLISLLYIVRLNPLNILRN